ncbi:hypothetical protein ACFV23_16725 [Streptomyces sp. NPDC059627]
MFIAVTFGVSGAIWLAGGGWLVRRQRRRHARTLAGWAALALGVAQLLHAAASLTEDRQPLGLVLALCSAALSVVGYLVLNRDGALGNRRTAWKRRKRRKLPPIR